MDYNTIILLKNEKMLDDGYYRKFQAGDTIWGENESPEELKRWSIADEADALLELSNHLCTYIRGRELWFIEEYALEYCECDEDGEFVQGSDFDLALKDFHGMKWGDLDFLEQESLMENAYVVNPLTGEGTRCVEDLEDGKYLINLKHPFSISGNVENGKIVIDDDAIVYDGDRETL